MRRRGSLRAVVRTIVVWVTVVCFLALGAGLMMTVWVALEV